MSDFQTKASTAEVSEVMSEASLLRTRLEQPNEGAPGFTLEGGTNKIIQENRTNQTIQESEANITIEESGPNKTIQESGTNKTIQESGTNKTIEKTVTNKTIGVSGLVQKDQISLLKYIMHKQIRKKLLCTRAHEIGDRSVMTLDNNEAAGTQPINVEVADNSAPRSSGNEDSN